MKRRSYIFGILSAVIFFIIITIAFKFTGSYSKYPGVYYPPMNWEEYFNFIPKLVLASLFVGIVMAIMYKQGKEMELKKEEEYSKRRAEREKQEQLEKENADK